MPVSSIRLRALNDKASRGDGEFVLYWMIANRRAAYNHALDRAIDWAEQFGKPLVILEALRVGYRWASDRLHSFVIDGMAENRRRFSDLPVTYYPYLEPTAGAGSGLLEALAAKACVVVTDDFPCFFLPRMIDAAARRLPVAMEAVDSNGLLPMRAASSVFLRAFDFRRFLQKELPKYFADSPSPKPFAKTKLIELPKLSKEIENRWPRVDTHFLDDADRDLSALPIDHNVAVSEIRGGSAAAFATLSDFLKNKLHRYGEERSEPEKDMASGLSPYLHFGHLSVHEIFVAVAKQEGWKPGDVSGKVNGSKDGWWGMSPSAESFVDELITWRELGYNMCWQRPDYDQFESLPDWVQTSLGDHADDVRQFTYSLEQFEKAQTHDDLWNAAQTQLVREGRMQNYLRMLWGKKILEWSASPRVALDVMIELNNKYALDGRNPNSYSGIFWVLGRYDRPWAPKRPVFGTIRYMSSDNTARKFRVKNYIAKYSPRTGELFE